MPLQIRRRPRADDSHLPTTLHPLLRQIFASAGRRPALLERSASQLLPPQRLFWHGAGGAAAGRGADGAKRILIVGDFDCDGATSSAPVRAGFARHGGRHIDFLVPNRLSSATASPEIVELAVARGAEFPITVDNGISSIAGVAAARRQACRYWLPITICPVGSCLTPTR